MGDQRGEEDGKLVKRVYKASLVGITVIEVASLVRVPSSTTGQQLSEVTLSWSKAVIIHT